MNFANYLNMHLFFTLICELFSYCPLDTNHIWERRIYTKELTLTDWLVRQHIDYLMMWEVLATVGNVPWTGAPVIQKQFEQAKNCFFMISVSTSAWIPVLNFFSE